MSYFTDMLDNAADAQTIELEIAPLSSFQNLQATIQEIDAKDFEILKTMGKKVNADIKPESFSLLMQDLFDLIRNVWDKAYSYGYYDGLVECDETDLWDD